MLELKPIICKKCSSPVDHEALYCPCCSTTLPAESSVDTMDSRWLLTAALAFILSAIVVSDWLLGTQLFSGLLSFLDAD